MALQVWLPLNKNGVDKNQGLANINITSTATYNTSGKLGGSYDFSDSSKRISFPSQSWMAPNDTNSISIAMWVKADSFNYIIATTAFEYRLLSNGFMWRLGNGVTNTFSVQTSEITFTTGIWYHLCGTWNAKNKKLTVYVNGELVKEATSTLTSYNGISSTINLVYGGSWNINDFRFYNHCLSPKEVKEISKGLVLHYPLNDAYVEGTTNLVTSITKGGQTTVNGYEVTTSGVSKDTYFTLNLSEKIVAGNTYTISCRNNFDTGLYWDFPIGSQANQTLTWRITSGYSSYTFIANSGNSYWDNNTCFMDDLSGTARNAGKSFKMWDWQIEKKDHATPFVIGTRNETTVHDCSGYQNNGTIFRALNCIGDSPRYKISTHFTSSIPSRIMLPSDMSCLSGNNEQTLSCWVRSYGLGSGMTQSGLISLGYGNTLFLGTSGYYYRIDNGSSLGSIGANQNPHDGNWHLVTATYKSGVASIYIDGILKNSVSCIFSNRYINIGGNCIGTEVNNSPVYNLNGDISDIRMYATALSADDIKELYNTSAYVLDNGTLLTYNLEE